ncbi:MAG: organoarsenical effux MFS transporter ArsJ [Alphaproteobacteria bacterium]|nr:organoarsenical effux MFS transporter ArsJ [Alphaproteobacteria bacterium]MBF0250129.1 organoarsenical effux MFS transporter ArsJ [Alphaproteobacteria bacterium]
MTIGIRDYALVTGAYWGFTLTDGALRMLVLLHFHDLGFSPFDIALLFLFYEFFGVVTNLVGGWIASRLGLKVTLFSGLALQVLALSALAHFDPGWVEWAGVAYVMAAQALSGIAKDLTKMSSKSAVKTLVPDEQHGALFKWVAVLTGSKNALKGVGFFLGGVLLGAFGFRGALLAMAGGLVVVLALSVLMLPTDIGRAKVKVKFTQILSKSRDVNVLSAARFFLFGSRDIWFVVGLPLFLAAQLGWSHAEVGAYMAGWVIAYGFIQAIAPRVLGKGRNAPGGAVSRMWILALLGVTGAIAWAVAAEYHPGLVVVAGLAAFGFVFAVNSAVHSYLILAYTHADHVALNVGFYYMANAAGRLAGTVLSGWAYQWGGMSACLWTSAAFVAAAWAASLALPPGRAQSAYDERH